MSEPTTPTEIANLALDLIKTENIQDVVMTKGDEIAVVMGRWYDICKRACLEGFPWNFASDRKAIPLSSPAPTFGYTDSYDLPDNFVSLNFIECDNIPLSQWDYTIEKNKILINNSGAVSLNIGYVFNSDDIAKWTSAFKLYVAYQLVFFTVFKLTGQNAIATRLEGKISPIRMNAKAINGLANPPKAYRQSVMITARRRFRTNGTSQSRI